MKINCNQSDESVRTILERVGEGGINLNPPFQRGEVWDRVRQARLIESVLLGIPVPPIYCICSDGIVSDVIDGKQRLTSLKSFREGLWPLKGCDIDATLNGKSWGDLTPAQQSTFQMRGLRLCRMDSTPEDRGEVISCLFDRLNSGLKLSPTDLANGRSSGNYQDLVARITPYFHSDVTSRLPVFFALGVLLSPEPPKSVRACGVPTPWEGESLREFQRKFDLLSEEEYSQAMGLVLSALDLASRGSAFLLDNDFLKASPRRKTSGRITNLSVLGSGMFWGRSGKSEDPHKAYRVYKRQAMGSRNFQLSSECLHSLCQEIQDKWAL